MNVDWWRRPSCPGLILFLLANALSIPPGRGLIEQSMVWHMAVQMPMLVAGGWLLADDVSQLLGTARLGDWNRYGLSGFIASQFIAAYWMLPLEIDRAVVLPWVDALKVMSLFTCGVVLKRSFTRSPAVLQLFFVGYAVSMLITSGLFLATTDRRLCNAYSLDTQTGAGIAVAGWGTMLAVAWAWHVFRTFRMAGICTAEPQWRQSRFSLRATASSKSPGRTHRRRDP